MSANNIVKDILESSVIQSSGPLWIYHQPYTNLPKKKKKLKKLLLQVLFTFSKY